MLVTREAARQDRVALLAGGRVWHGRHAGPERHALVLGVPGIAARTHDHASVRAERLAQFAEYADAAEAGVVHAGERRVRLQLLVHGRTQRMLVLLQVRADRGGVCAPCQVRGNPAAGRAPVGIGRGRKGHRRRRCEVAQAEVVHHVVDVVVVDLRLDVSHDARQVPALESQAEVVAVEGDAIHGAIGVSRLAVTARPRQFEAQVVARCPAERAACTPALVGRVHGRAGTVVVVVRLRARAGDLAVDGGGPDAEVPDEIVAPEARAERTGVRRVARALESLHFAFERHRRGGVARPAQHRLRALGDDDAVVGFGEDIGRGRVHAHAAAAEQLLAVDENVDARGRHAAEHGVSVRAALADHGETRDGLQVVRPVVRRQWLAWGLRIGRHHERRVHARRRDDDLVESISGMDCAREQQCGGHGRDDGGPAGRA